MFEGFKDENRKLGIYFNELEGINSKSANNLRTELLTTQTNGNEFIDLYFNEFLKGKYE